MKVDVYEKQAYNVKQVQHPASSAFKAKIDSSRKEYIIEECGNHVYGFLNENMDLADSGNLIISTTSRFNILNQLLIYDNIVNLKRVNDIRYVNKFFESVNGKLISGGTFIGRAETKNFRKKRILKKYPAGLNYIYYSLDFVLKRIFPKLPVTKKIYFFLTRGNNRVMSRAEVLGRLVACGFEIDQEIIIDGNLFFVARKVREPLFPEDPTFGPLIKLKRVGKNGKVFNVFKLRTMHPFSEFLQEYVYQNNSLDKSGKFKDDFRISTLGKIFRKFWIDELPMFINFFRGEMKLVGVRPISQHYFSLYPRELREKRIQYKPGLFPPYYADMPQTLDEIVASELNYLEQYEKNRFLTDLKYFQKIFINIVFHKARSK